MADHLPASTGDLDSSRDLQNDGCGTGDEYFPGSLTGASCGQPEGAWGSGQWRRFVLPRVVLPTHGASTDQEVVPAIDALYSNGVGNGFRGVCDGGEGAVPHAPWVITELP